MNIVATLSAYLRDNYFESLEKKQIMTLKLQYEIWKKRFR